MNPFSCEVVVIGGGLSGCAAASGLARAGVDVALFEAESLPRHRVCGEFLSPESRAVLGRMGVLEILTARGAREVEIARFCCAGASADFDLGRASGLAISRYALDPILFEAAQSAGAHAFLGARARGLRARNEDGSGGFRFESGGETWHSQSVILAAGRAASPKTSGQASGTKKDNSPRFCGLKAHFSGVYLPVGTVEMHLFRGGYCGLVRVEGQATNACMMIEYSRLGKNAPGAFWTQLLAQNPELRARMTSATQMTPWCSTGNVSFEKFRPVSEARTHTVTGAQSGEITPGVLCAGDAAGYIHPLTGDGMAMALRAGELAATCARLHIGGLAAGETARLYQAAWHREFAARLQLAAQLHPFALRPEWAGPVLPVLAHLPRLRRALVRGTRGR